MAIRINRYGGISGSPDSNHLSVIYADCRLKKLKAEAAEEAFAGVAVFALQLYDGLTAESVFARNAKRFPCVHNGVFFRLYPAEHGADVGGFVKVAGSGVVSINKRCHGIDDQNIDASA